MLIIRIFFNKNVNLNVKTLSEICVEFNDRIMYIVYENEMFRLFFPYWLHSEVPTGKRGLDVKVSFCKKSCIVGTFQVSFW